MSRLIDKIDINLVKEEIVDIEEIKSNLNKRVVQNDILRKESRTETSDATFDSDIWIIDKPLTQGYINLNMHNIPLGDEQMLHSVNLHIHH